ncbi:hypothetical protein BS50DRAFT_337983 [Corynespora cassiicola Philippines]|uniref:RING-type domain-containing protein n=1 Tax=Corynespora cassiicola Philippines TaxID=1448308 RepID=A0A2T2NV74_CORCC|nr:hypothetical protein BS50DRAFT_337983 [Corynespora cassiicola Philippines]
MGQANSRGGASESRPRSRIRPTSWAPSLSPPQPQHDSLSELRSPSHSTTTPSSWERINPFSNLSTHSEHSDAGPSSQPAAATVARRRSRITRARSSLSAIPNLFHRRTSSRPREPEPSFASASTSPLPSPGTSTLRRETSDGPERGSPFLPRMQPLDLDLSFEDITSSHTHNDHPVAHLPRLRSERRDGRASSMLPSLGRPDRGLRSMTSSLRRRRSPLRRDEDQAAMLSRLLSVAAAATAASLMGNDHRAVSEARSVAGDGEDGTFDSFLQALQNGRIASALRQSGNEGEEGTDTPGGNPAPLNFFRMFRFGSSAGDRRGEARAGSRNGTASSENQDGEEDGDGRMVPIIIVGIRSINPGSGAGQDDNIPPFLDALSSFPTPLASPGDNALDGMLRQPQNGTRFSHRRRASMGGLNNFPANYDSQRHYRAPERPRPWSTVTDSPSGPLPPPSTPASSGLSAVSSGTTTPTLSASPPSPTIPSAAPSRRGSFVRRTTGSGLEPTAEETQTHHRTPRQRRLSESDFTRFGSGASRRNGVVEPDHNPGEGSRSWIIYVLGGSYPENHPILTTPSLFTDSPTYEDMLLLSSLLGPAKPPVASEEDVASAPGLFTINGLPDNLFAEAVGGTEVISLAADTRCLVCLCDFEVGEEARKLVKCGHLFHRLCIDQVSCVILT